MDLLANLNEAQQRAAFAPPGPWLVLAGPGTGKTRTLVARIWCLIDQYQIRPDRILAVTYTNKATEEMRERLQARLGAKAASLQCTTFHSFCMQILRKWHENLGLVKHFAVADEDCQLRAAARSAPMLAGERHVRFMLGRLSGARLNPGDTRPLSSLERQIRQRYENELRKNCLVDYDDILFYTQRLFFEYPQILARYRSDFDAVLIDEFQDTDRVQYEIIKQLVSEHKNLFVVADDDQSIFSWRGANPNNIDLFRREFAHDNVILLTENYRSRAEIIEQARQLINLNFAPEEQSQRKSVQAARAIDRAGALSPFDAVRVENFANDQEESAYIIKEIRRQMEREPSLTFADFAVLYARHSVGEYLEREFMKSDLPCQLVRGRSSFDQPEIVRTLSLLRILYNPKDQYSLEDFVAREVDEVTYARLKTLQRQEGLADFRAALDRFRKRHWVPEQERQQVEKIIGLISNLFAFKNSQGGRRLSELFAEILNSLSKQEVLTLAGQVDKLTDPLSYGRMREAAGLLHEARSAARPVIVIAANDQLRLLAIETIKRALGLNAMSAHAYVLEHMLKDPRSDSPLLVTLDSHDLSLITSQIGKLHAVIYLGIDYSPLLREELRALNAVVINPEELAAVERGFEASAVGLLFKLCQAAAWIGTADFLSDYVALDIETTDRDVETNDIIELAAVRVRNGQPVEHFHSLVKPERAIAADAEKVHGISEDQLANAPSFHEIADRFLEFIGQDVLLAHNGYNFDFPCLKRKLREIGRKMENRTFDTLPMASRLFPERSANLDALASIFNIDTGQRHRAYDDTVTLIEIFEKLKKEHASRLRRTACEQCLDLVAAGMVIEQGRIAEARAILLKEGLARLTLPGSIVMERLSEQEGDLTQLRALIEEAKTERLRSGITNDDRMNAFINFDQIVARFNDRENLNRSIEAFLDFAALYQQQDGISRRNAVNLMTIYAAKGLEFTRVFIAGLEQNIIPSFYAVGSKSAEQIAEQRRLLYVAITRAKEQLVFTSAALRNGYPQALSEFLIELLSPKK